MMKLNIYETVIEINLLLKKSTDWHKKKLDALEIDAIRKSMRISRRKTIRNETIKQQSPSGEEL